jgi:hypothetical protein
MNEEELLIWMNTTLKNKSGGIDANKLRSPKYAKEIQGLEALIDEPITLQQKVWLLEHNYRSIPLCSCGNKVRWTRKGFRYSKYCSQKCAMIDPEIKIRRKATNMEKYGCEVPTQNEEVKAKRVKTNIAKYGVATPFEMRDFREKSNVTMIAKYGVDNPQKSKAIREQTATTNMERYGAPTPLQGSSKDKATATMLDKYGAEYAFQSPVLFKKFKETMLQRYGTEHALQNSDIQDAEVKKRFLKLYNRVTSGDRVANRVIPMFSFEEYKGTEDSYPWKCLACGLEFSDHLQDGHIPRCHTCFPYLTNSSAAENELALLITSWGIPLQTSNRSLIPPYELDILLPEHNIAIEFNGLYWHSELGGRRGSTYHLRKYELCKEQGVELIQIFEDEWINKKDIVASIIRSRLGLYTTRYFARDLAVLGVPIETQRQFLDSHHIQGYIPSTLAIGLYKDEHLLSIATFIHSRYASSAWELLRYSTLPGTRVVGGLSRLISAFRKIHPEGDVISYCDKRLFTGAGYTAVGFTKLKDSLPNYFYTKSYKERSSRVKFQKHKLSKLLETFNPELTEWENMQNNGYDRIWDAGNMVFVLTNHDNPTAPRPLA